MAKDVEHFKNIPQYFVFLEDSLFCYIPYFSKNWVVCLLDVQLTFPFV